MRKCLILSMMCLCVVACKNPSSKKNNCEKILKHEREFINNFYSSNNVAYLDSALVLIHKIEGKCDQFKDRITADKLIVFYYKKEYDEAIKWLYEIDDDILTPFMKQIDMNHIKAKEAADMDDTKAEKQYYQNIVNIFADYLNDNNGILEYILSCNKGQTRILTLDSYYYYKAKIDDQAVLLRELDSLQRIHKGEEQYFDELRRIVRGESQYNPLFF